MAGENEDRLEFEETYTLTIKGNIDGFVAESNLRPGEVRNYLQIYAFAHSLLHTGLRLAWDLREFNFLNSLDHQQLGALAAAITQGMHESWENNQNIEVDCSCGKEGVANEYVKMAFKGGM